MNKYDFKTIDIVVEPIYGNKNSVLNSVYLYTRLLDEELIDIIIKYVEKNSYYFKEITNTRILLNILPNYEVDAIITDIKDYCMKNKLSFLVAN